MSISTKQLNGNEFRETHTVGHSQAGIRLDRFLMDRYRKRSRAQLVRAISRGVVTIIRESSPHLHPGRIKPSFALHPGDLVQLLKIRRPEPEVNFDYQVIYEDEALLLIDKPPNLPVHPVGRYFFNTLLTHLNTDGFKKELEAKSRFFLVHRIDRETSGILLIAKTREACIHLTAQFRNRETSKYYLAIVKGVPQNKHFSIDAAMGKKKGSRVGLKMYAIPEAAGGFPSQTEFEVIESRDGFTLLACFPRTGRQHQIRLHAELAGFPLVGDKIYGLSDAEVLSILDARNEDDTPETVEDATDDSLADPFLDSEDDTEAPESLVRQSVMVSPELEAKLMLPRHALHAAGLRFKHPTSGKEMIFESGLPKDLKTFFEKITGQKLAKFLTRHW